MSAHNPQVVEPQALIDVTEYIFSGDKYTVERKRTFILCYREHGSILHAAHATPVSRKCVYLWMDQDPEFAQAIADVREDNVEELETSVYRRAFTDNLLAMFYLKAHRHKFRDKVTIDVEVVRNEIQERLAQLQLTQSGMQIPPQPDDQQKESLPPAYTHQRTPDSE